MTVNEMLELQHVIPGSSLENLKTASVFRNVCHLFGEEKLTKMYEEKLSALLISSDRKKDFQEQVLQIIRHLLETYCIEKISKIGMQQDVKKEVYRFTSLVVEQLSIFFGIFGQRSWQCIKEMSIKRKLTEDGAKNLLIALSITTELRLKCYQNHGRQKKALPTVPQLSVTNEKNPTCPSTTAIVRLYQSLTPLSSVLSHMIKIFEIFGISEPEPLVVSVLQTVDFMDVSPMTTAWAYIRVLQLRKAIDLLLSAKNSTCDIEDKVNILLGLSKCYILVGRFQEAIECCREVQTLYSVAPDDVRLLPVLKNIMSICVDQGLYNDAVKLYEQIMVFQGRSDLKESLQENFDFVSSSADLFKKIKQYDIAEAILKPMIEKSRNQQEYYFFSLNNLAAVLLNMDKTAEVKTTYWTKL